MALYLEAGWDFIARPMRMLVDEGVDGSFQIVCDSNGVQHANSSGASLVVSDADTQWCHTDLSSVLGTGLYDDLATILATAMTAGSAAHAGTRTYTVSWTRATQLYSVSNSNNDLFGLTFTGLAGDDANGTEGAAMRRTLGYSTDQTSPGPFASDVRPYYSIVTSTGARSEVTADYEPASVVSSAYSLGGSHYAIGASAAIKFFDFTCQFEDEAASQKSAAPDGTTAGDVPWTYEHLFEHCRGDQPFMSSDGTNHIVHYLRGEGAAFNRPRAQLDWDMWHIPLRTVLKGRI